MLLAAAATIGGVGRGDRARPPSRGAGTASSPTHRRRDRQQLHRGDRSARLARRAAASAPRSPSPARRSVCSARRRWRWFARRCAGRRGCCSPPSQHRGCSSSSRATRRGRTGRAVTRCRCSSASRCCSASHESPPTPPPGSPAAPAASPSSCSTWRRGQWRGAGGSAPTGR